MQQRQPRHAGVLATLGLAALALNAPAWGQMQEKPRTIAVSGQAEVPVKPDRARLQLGVTHTSLELRAAETAVNDVVRAYVAEARKLGVRDEQLSTTGISIQPEYSWDEKERSNRLIGYRVSRDIVVVISDLDRLGAHLLAASRAGINQLRPPQLESSRARELQNQALVKAAQDAQAKARLLADTLGVKLGAVRSLSEASQAQPMPMVKTMAMRADAAMDAASQMGLETGEIRYAAAVSAEFDVTP